MQRGPFPHLMAVFQRVLQLQPHLMTLHVDFKVLLVQPRLRFCWLGEPVQHLSIAKGKRPLVNTSAVDPGFHLQCYCSSTFCFSFSVQMCLLLSTKLNKASCSLVSPASFFFVCARKGKQRKSWKQPLEIECRTDCQLVWCRGKYK